MDLRELDRRRYFESQVKEKDGLPRMWDYVTAMERGEMPERATLEYFADCFREILKECTHFYDADPPEHFDPFITKTDNKQTAAAVLKRLHIERPSKRPNDPALDHWFFEIDWRYHELVYEKKLLPKAVLAQITEEQHTKEGKPKPTPEEVSALAQKYRREKHKHEVSWAQVHFENKHHEK